MRYLTLILIVFFLPSTLWSQEANNKQSQDPSQSGWSTSVRGGTIYQFDTDLDDGGSYSSSSSSRYNIEVSQSYAWTRKDTATLALSYSLDNYDFSDGESGGIAFGSPWENIHTLSISTPLRMGVGNNWTAFLIPSIRSTGESGAEFSDTITGGGFTGIS